MDKDVYITNLTKNIQKQYIGNLRILNNNIILVKKELLSQTNKLEIIKKYISKKPSTEKELTEVYSVLCFGNIGYCCGLLKSCRWRDAVRMVLELPDEFYAKEKEKAGMELFLKNGRKRQ